MNTTACVTALFAASFLLSGCDRIAEKVTEKATEKLAEKAIESQSKDGSKARVDLSGGTAKFTTTDASGKTSTMEWGGARISEADLGVPFYAGAAPVEGGSSRVAMPDAVVMTVALHSDDPADKVVAFYREKLKSRAEGKQFLDMSMGDGGTSLTIADEKARNTVQVNVSKSEQGSDINIVVSRSQGR